MSVKEIDFIREQIATEHRHFDAVQGALAEIVTHGVADAALMSFCARCVEYVVFAAARIHARDQAHLETLRARLPAGALGDQRVLQELEAAWRVRAGATEGLAARSARALGASPGDPALLLSACRDYVKFWRDRLRSDSQSIYHLCDEHYSVGDWRRASLVTADSILEERRLYAGVRAAAPAGMSFDN